MVEIKKCENCAKSENYRADCLHIKTPIKNRVVCFFYELVKDKQEEVLIKMIYEICIRCKWKEIKEPNKCQTCKHNSLIEQDYYEMDNETLKQQLKDLKEKEQTCGENTLFRGLIKPDD